MLKTNYTDHFIDFDKLNRLKFCNQLKSLLAQALIDQEPIIQTEEFTMSNLTEEYIAGRDASERLRSYYSHVVYPLLDERYFHEGENSEDQLFRRVSQYVARDEIDEDIFYYMMRLRIFMPATPTLMNSGREKSMLSSCFTMVPEDDMESIADYWKTMSLIQKHGGGVGVGWDNIRPAGSPVGGTGGIASGWKPYFEVANHINAAVKQGSARSGANAATMRVDHPQIFDFIDVKREDPAKYMFFNLSVTFTDEQFESCLARREIALHHEKGNGHEIVNGYGILERMAENAWKNGDPSPYFIDRANRVWDELVLGRFDPWGKPYRKKCSHNPCGEQCLPDHGACNLASLNLFALVDPISSEINTELFEHATRAALRFLDGVVDKNWFPSEKIKMQSDHLRNVGLGYMGLADLFYIMGVPYGSEESVDIAETVTQQLTDWAWSESRALGKLLGPAPVFAQDNSNSITDVGKTYPTINPAGDVPYRNSDVTSIAPTGSISMIALASSGIEPYFSTNYKKLIYPKGTVMKEKRVDIIPPAMMYFEHSKPEPPTAMKIDPYKHIDVLAVVAKNVTNSVSKTVNLPNKFEVEDVIDIYRYAFEQGCTSLTIFRDGCREDLALINQENEKDPHDWLMDITEEERQLMLKREPFSMDKLEDMMHEEGSDPIFEEDHEMIQHSKKPIHGKRSYPIEIDDDSVFPIPEKLYKEIMKPPTGFVNISKKMFLKHKPDPIAFEREYLANPIENVKKGVCQDCGSNNVRRQEGCIYCNECSWSMCSTS